MADVVLSSCLLTTVVTVSLSVNITECKHSSCWPVAYPICRSACLSVQKMYCGKTADSSQMPFGVVSGVGRGMGVLDGDPRAPRRRRGFGFFLFALVWTVYFLKQKCIPLVCGQYFHMENMSFETYAYWLSKNILSFKIEVGIC